MIPHKSLTDCNMLTRQFLHKLDSTPFATLLPPCIKRAHVLGQSQIIGFTKRNN